MKSNTFKLLLVLLLTNLKQIKCFMVSLILVFYYFKMMKQ